MRKELERDERGPRWRRGGSGSSHDAETTADEAGCVDVQLIAGFQLSLAGQPVWLPAGAERTLAFLALHGARVGRSYVAGCLWPELTEQRARANLRTALWRLRGAEGSPVLSDDRSLQLADGVCVDLYEARAVARRLLQDPERTSLSDCRHEGLAADLLPDWYDDWAAMERERYRHLRLHALEAASRRLTLLGKYGEAVQAAAAAACAEPLRESSHRALIAAYLAEGNVQCALRQFELFRALLDRELGLLPSEQMRAQLEVVRSATGSVRRSLAGAG